MKKLIDLIKTIKKFSLSLLYNIKILLIFCCINSCAQEMKYGINDKNGRYANAGDAKIYYEVYGEGKPIVLLHGGFSYIDQYKQYIPELSKKYKVIAIATRGYGRSEIGSQKYSYNLLADDVKAVIQKEGKDKAIIIGFSDGAMVSYIVASKYPEVVDKVVAMSGPLGTSGYAKEGLDWLKTFNSSEFERYRPDFKGIMPQPQRWDEFIENLKLLWVEPNIISFDSLGKIKCPVLLLAGEHDLYCRVEHMTEIKDHIKDARLILIPNASHIDVSPRNMTLFKQYILSFLN